MVEGNSDFVNGGENLAPHHHLALARELLELAGATPDLAFAQAVCALMRGTVTFRRTRKLMKYGIETTFLES